MFNSYSNNNSFSYNINAVSGTLRKSHPKSKIIINTISNDLRVFNKERPHIYLDYNKEPEIVVLQVMLCGNDKILIEFVEKADFEELVGDK